MSPKRRNTVNWLDLSLRSMLELLVLKKYAECTSQRFKRTSGARVMILSLSDYFCVIFIDLAGGQRPVTLPVVKIIFFGLPLISLIIFPGERFIFLELSSLCSFLSSLKYEGCGFFFM